MLDGTRTVNNNRLDGHGLGGGLGGGRCGDVLGTGYWVLGAGHRVLGTGSRVGKKEGT